MKVLIFASVLLVGLAMSGCATSKSSTLAPRFITVEEMDCEIHHVPMHKKAIMVYHGLEVLSAHGEKLAKAEARRFPHAQENILVSGDESGEAEVYECPECRRTKEQWIIAHPDPDLKGGPLLRPSRRPGAPDPKR